MRQPRMIDLLLPAMAGRGRMHLSEINAAVEPLFTRFGA